MKSPLHFFILGIIVLLSGLGATAVFADQGANFSLQVPISSAAPQKQSYYILEGQSGTTLENSIWVVNVGTAVGTVQLYAVDMVTGNTGGAMFLLRDDARQVTGSWITLADSELTLAAGESREIPFTVSIPADARAGEHLGGIVAEAVEAVETLDVHENADSASFQVKVKSRNAVAVQVNLPGALVEQIDVTGITAGGHGGYQTLALGLGNVGNVMLRPTGRLVVSDEAGEQVQDLQFAMDTFLPETAVQYPLFVEEAALPAGEYRADLTLQYGLDKQSAHQLSFAITEAQVAQVFGAREALEAPVSAAGKVGEAAQAFPGLALSGLIAFNVILALFLVGFVFNRRRKQASRPRE